MESFTVPHWHHLGKEESYELYEPRWDHCPTKTRVGTKSEAIQWHSQLFHEEGRLLTQTQRLDIWSKYLGWWVSILEEGATYASTPSSSHVINNIHANVGSFSVMGHTWSSYCSLVEHLSVTYLYETLAYSYQQERDKVDWKQVLNCTLLTEQVLEQEQGPSASTPSMIPILYHLLLARQWYHRLAEMTDVSYEKAKKATVQTYLFRLVPVPSSSKKESVFPQVSEPLASTIRKALYMMQFHTQVALRLLQILQTPKSLRKSQASDKKNTSFLSIKMADRDSLLDTKHSKMRSSSVGGEEEGEEEEEEEEEEEQDSFSTPRSRGTSKPTSASRPGLEAYHPYLPAKERLPILLQPQISMGTLRGSTGPHAWRSQSLADRMAQVRRRFDPREPSILPHQWSHYFGPGMGVSKTHDHSLLLEKPNFLNACSLSILSRMKGITKRGILYLLSHASLEYLLSSPLLHQPSILLFPLPSIPDVARDTSLTRALRDRSYACTHSLHQVLYFTLDHLVSAILEEGIYQAAYGMQRGDRYGTLAMLRLSAAASQIRTERGDTLFFGKSGNRGAERGGKRDPSETKMALDKVSVIHFVRLDSDFLTQTHLYDAKASKKHPECGLGAYGVLLRERESPYMIVSSLTANALHINLAKEVLRLFSDWLTFHTAPLALSEDWATHGLFVPLCNKKNVGTLPIKGTKEVITTHDTIQSLKSGNQWLQHASHTFDDQFDEWRQATEQVTWLRLDAESKALQVEMRTYLVKGQTSLGKGTFSSYLTS